MTGVRLDLAITGIGLYCPTGSTAQSACAAMRAGIAIFEELDYVDDHGEPVYGAAVRVIESLSRSRRAAALLEGALADVRQSPFEPCPTILVMAPNQARTERALIDALPVRPALTIRGHATAGLVALAHAAELLATGQTNRVLICAVDCSITARGLHDLREAGRLRMTGNPHGVRPGEAAACLVVERAGSATGPRIVSLGLAEEPATPSNDVPLRARGLTTAIRSALELAALDMSALDWRLANHGDEGLFVKDHSLALARVLEVPKPALPLWQPAEFIGELGPVAGLVEIIWATVAWARHYAPGPTALCMCSDPAGPRAAAVVSRT